MAISNLLSDSFWSLSVLSAISMVANRTRKQATVRDRDRNRWRCDDPRWIEFGELRFPVNAGCVRWNGSKCTAAPPVFPRRINSLRENEFTTWTQPLCAGRVQLATENAARPIFEIIKRVGMGHAVVSSMESRFRSPRPQTNDSGHLWRSRISEDWFPIGVNDLSECPTPNRRPGNSAFFDSASRRRNTFSPTTRLRIRSNHSLGFFVRWTAVTRPVRTSLKDDPTQRERELWEHRGPRRCWPSFARGAPGDRQAPRNRKSHCRR